MLKEKIRNKDAAVMSDKHMSQSFMEFIASNLTHDSMLVSPYVSRGAHHRSTKGLN